MSDFSPRDFDKYDCVKLSWLIYICLAYVLRGYVVWIMSVTNMQDRVGVIQSIYPEQSLFYLSLLSGSLGILLVFLLSMRRPDAGDWVKRLCRKLRILLIATMLFDLMINAIAYFKFEMISGVWLAVQALIVGTLAVLLMTSKRIAFNIEEFPEKLPEK